MAVERARSEPEPRPCRITVFGIGNELRGDDAVGPTVAARIRPAVGAAAEVVTLPSVDAGLLGRWEGLDLAIVIDAIRAGRPPGAIERIEVGGSPLPSDLGTTSTHGFSLAQVVALGQALGRMPRRLVIFGVESRDFAPGTALSGPVAAAIPRTGDRVLAEIADALPGPDLPRRPPHA